jgi:hypothetical protein
MPKTAIAPQKQHKPYETRQHDSERAREKARESPAAVGPERIAAFLEELPARHRSTLREMTEQQLRLQGLQNIREGSDRYSAARDKVVSDVIRHELDMDNIAAEIALAKADKG